VAHPLAPQFRRQARNCLPGSPLYAGLLDAMAADLDDGGPTATVMEPYRDDRSASAPPLRLMGALHRMVLQGHAPELALHYPSVGGSASARQAWPAARRLLEAAGTELAGLAGRPVQTNEVGRCAALLGALLVVATRTGLPIRLFEIGASAGLNLNVDRYAYAVDNRLLGQPDSTLRLRSPWRNYPPAELSLPVRLVERAGCDPLPVDPGSTEGRLTLDPQGGTRPRLLRSPEDRRQDLDGSHALPKTTTVRRRLPTTPRRRPSPVDDGSGRTTGGDTSIQRGRLTPRHRHFGPVTARTRRHQA